MCYLLHSAIKKLLVLKTSDSVGGMINLKFIKFGRLSLSSVGIKRGIID